MHFQFNLAITEPDMKKLLVALFALVSSLASAATTVPVQLLNPTGSSAGQAIVSTGASSAPAWGGIGLNGIAAIGGNTVLANATGSSSAPTAFAMPSCSTASSALNYTTNTGIGCNTSINAATLSGNAVGTSGTAIPLLSGANTWGGAQTFNALITPASSIGIKATATNDVPAPGSFGEYANALTPSPVSMTSNTTANVLSISLTPGEWDTQCVVQTNPAGITTTSGFAVGMSTTSAGFMSTGTGGPTNATAITGVSISAGQHMILSTPVSEFSFASTTTVYCVANVQFAASTLTTTGFIRARRPR